MTSGTAYIFPSQVPLTRDLANECLQSTNVRLLLDIASDALGYDLITWLTRSSETELQHQKYRRPVINCLSLASYRCERDRATMSPTIFAGMSLGWLTAAAAAGCLSVEEMVRISSLQATIEMEHFAETDLVSVFFISGNVERVYAELAEGGMQHLLHFSARASSDQFLAGARLSDLARMSDCLAKAGALPRPIPDSFPGHCDLMEHVETEFAARWIPQDRLANSLVPLLNLTNCRPTTSATDISRCIVEQYTTPMDWSACMQYIQNLELKDYVVLEPSSFITKSLEIDSRVAFTFRTAGIRNDE